MRSSDARLVMLLVVGSLAIGCSSSHGGASNQSPDQIGGNDNPNNLIPGASTLLTDNIVPSDVGQTFGVDDAHIPYPDTYWPFMQEGTNAAWNGSVGPLEKFMAVVDAAHAPDAKNWEHTNHGPAVANVASWWGHCPGWTGASMANAPILHAVDAASDGNGGLTSCNAGEAGCTKFEIGDINALEAEAWVDGPNNFIGARCDTSPNSIQRDQYGRIVRTNSGGCQGLNAGALLIVLGNRMKRQHLPMAIDAQNDFNTDQIWNQPAYRYQVYEYQPLTTAQAANMVAHGTMTGDQTTYSWDTSAQGFVMVDIGIKWVSENGPNTEVVSGASSTSEMRFVAVVELDAANDDPGAKIIGGEYVVDANAGSDRLTVPPFVWVNTGSGADLDPNDPNAANDGHNPWIKPSLVKQLIALGTTGQAAPPDGSDDAGAPGDDGGGATTDASTDPCNGAPDGSYCGGDSISGNPDTLYVCAGGVTSSSQACLNGCGTNDTGPGDTCF